MGGATIGTATTPVLFRFTKLPQFDRRRSVRRRSLSGASTTWSHHREAWSHDREGGTGV